MDVDEIIERLWPGLAAAVEPLGGGITNHNFRVSVSGEEYVLRIGGKDTELLGIDRSVEHAATLAAAAAGIGPEVIRFVEPEGYLVTRFIEGRPIPPEEMRRPENVRRVAAAIRRFHGGPRIPGRFDSFRIVEAYRENAAAHGVQIPADCAWAKGIAEEVERARGAYAERPCHNDYLNANFIDDGAAIRVVDWEYAGMGDIFFDLANFSVNHEFGEAENEVLLDAYFGEARAPERASLELMRFMSDFREAMWGVVQRGISELDFDFAGYAAGFFERMRRTAASPAFRASLPNEAN